MSTAPAVKRRASYDDLLKVPDTLVAEILSGDLYTTPRPSAPHAVASSGLGVEIGAPFYRGRGGPGGWWILDEPEVHFGNDVTVPDLAGWRRERMPALPTGHIFTIPPDWVCEVVSPSTERIDRVLKLPIYARGGVSYVWLVNPIARTLEVLQREGERWLLVATHGGDQIIRAAPFDAAEVDLLAIWGETRGAPAP